MTATRTRTRRPSRGAPAAPAPAAPARAARLGILLLRLYAGAFFVDTALWKLVEYPDSAGYGFTERFERFRDDEYLRLVEAAVADPPRAFGVPLAPFAAFLDGVMRPGAWFFAPAVLVGEALLGVSLVLGAGVRLSASLGFLMMLAFSMAKFSSHGGGPAEHLHVLTVHSANWPITLILLALALAAAGRFHGLDAVLRRVLPRGLRWVA